MVCGWRDADAQNEADARLVAAAPALLEALKLLVADFDDRGVTEGSIGHADRAIALATSERK